MDKQNLITITTIIMVLMVVIGATYAYFSIAITGNSNANSIVVKTASLGVIYTDGNEINVQNAKPGWNSIKNFTVKNNSDIAVYYNMNWVNVSNNFTNTSDLVYSITGNNSKESTSMPTTNGVIFTNIQIVSGATHSYTLSVNYSNTSNNQNIDMNKDFFGKISITEN